jgi:hypothetical protein
MQAGGIEAQPPGRGDSESYPGLRRQNAVRRRFAFTVFRDHAADQSACINEA